MQYKTTLSTALAACALAVSSSFALASPGHGEKPDIGQAGDVSKIDQVIEVGMTEMAFDPEEIEIETGTTVKFIVTNAGRAVHEFNLGTESMWDDHRGEMREMMKKGLMTMRELRHDKMMEAGMMHDDANSVLLEPGETAEIIWTFSGEEEVGFACNVPGHREAGMVGSFKIGGEEVSG
ncbi:MAG: cupredoxin domain-containing protein [Rhodobacteraceae bacterium]|nr:cupredoxin domain-containing protein [Paracoccaceae bacterium]